MPLDLFSTQGHYFQCRGRNRLDRRNYSLRSSRRPFVHSGFTLLLVGFLVLAAGNVLRGL